MKITKEIYKEVKEQNLFDIEYHEEKLEKAKIMKAFIDQYEVDKCLKTQENDN